MFTIRYQKDKNIGDTSFPSFRKTVYLLTAQSASGARGPNAIITVVRENEWDADVSFRHRLSVAENVQFWKSQYHVKGLDVHPNVLVVLERW